MKNIKNGEKESLIKHWWIFYSQTIFFFWKLKFFSIFFNEFYAFFNGFWFYSIMAGWSTWQWIFFNFSQNFWSFDTPDTPGCASEVIWNRFEPFLLQCTVMTLCLFHFQVKIGPFSYSTVWGQNGRFVTIWGECWWQQSFLCTVGNFPIFWIKS